MKISNNRLKETRMFTKKELRLKAMDILKSIGVPLIPQAIDDMVNGLIAKIQKHNAGGVIAESNNADMDISKKTLMQRAGLLKEGRITFNGTKADQLYRIIKDDELAMVFANGKQYGVDAEDMRNDLQNPVIIGYDEDGGEHDINVSDIEFIEL